MKRNSFEVLASMLEFAEEGKRKTEIMYQCNLNYLTTINSINLLIQKGMLEVNLPYYQTTNKGMCFMRKFREIEGLLIAGNDTGES